LRNMMSRVFHVVILILIATCMIVHIETKPTESLRLTFC